MTKRSPETNKFRQAQEQQDLSKKLQRLLEQITKSPTAASLMLQGRKWMENRSRIPLHGVILALETPYSDFIKYPSKMSKLKTAALLKESAQETSISAAIRENPCLISTDDGDYQMQKERESIVFNFGDNYSAGIDWDLERSKWFLDNLIDPKFDFLLSCDRGSIVTSMRDVEYSRDDVFKLSSQREMIKEFMRAKMF